MLLTPYLPMRWLLGAPDIAPSGTAVFPRLAGQGFKAKKAPTWGTTVQRTVSGRRLAISNMPYPRWQFEVSYEVLRQRLGYTELDQLVEFFNTQQGQGALWSYFDPDDNLVSGQPFGVGDGSTTTFQLCRSIRSWTEPVFSVNAISQVLVSGAPTTAYTLGQYGLVTFNTAPALNAPLVWSGSFMFLCAFDSDELDLEQIYSGAWAQNSLTWASEIP